MVPYGNKDPLKQPTNSQYSPQYIRNKTYLIRRTISTTTFDCVLGVSTAVCQIAAKTKQQERMLTCYLSLDRIFFLWMDFLTFGCASEQRNDINAVIIDRTLQVTKISYSLFG